MIRRVIYLSLHPPELSRRRSSLIHPLLVFGFAAVLAGCSLFPNAQESDVLFAESFDGSADKLGQYSRATGTAGVLAGEFQIDVLEPNYMQWSLVNGAFSDSIIELQARKAEGPDNNLYGVICRYQDDLNFYYLVVSSDGFYGIGRVLNGSRTLLSADQMQPTTAVQGGTAVNHLKAKCAGSTLALEVNGVGLVSVEDPNFAQGQVGLLAGDFSDSGVDIRFDNLLITQTTP